MVCQVDLAENLSVNEQDEACVAGRSFTQVARDVDRWRTERHQPFVCASHVICRSLAQLASLAIRLRRLRGTSIVGAPSVISYSFAQVTSFADRWHNLRRWPFVYAGCAGRRSLAQLASAAGLSRRDSRQRSIPCGAARVASTLLTEDAKMEHSRVLWYSASGDGDSPRLQTNHEKPCEYLNKKRTAT